MRGHRKRVGGEKRRAGRKGQGEGRKEKTRKESAE